MANELTLIPSGLGDQSALADTIEILYQAPTTNSILITAFTASNNTSTSVTYEAFIYDGLGANSGAIIPLKIVVLDRFDLGASIVNQTIPVGGSLRIRSSEANGLVFRVQGRQL